MSRRDSPNISILIDEYKKLKDEQSALKKPIEGLNKSIKDYMHKHGLNIVSSEKYTASLTTSSTESFNSDLAIEILKQNLEGELLGSVIKYKEYIDEDALEKLVYAKKFDINKMAKCKSVTTTTTLRISNKKD